jgi:predicted nucleic acid-binding protein
VGAKKDKVSIDNASLAALKRTQTAIADIEVGLGYASEDDVLISVMRHRYGRSNTKVLLDTDVILSALIFPDSDSAKTFEIVVDRQRMVLSDFTEEDLQTTFSHGSPKLGVALSQFLNDLDYEVAAPTGLNVATLTELDDTRLIDAALSAKVDVIVTNDRRFKAIGLAVPMVLTPAEYVR